MKRFPWIALLATVAACAAVKSKSSGTGSGGSGGSSGSGGTTFTGLAGVGGGSTGNGSCVNLQCKQTTCTGSGCQVPACTGDAKTTISGTVYDPAGKVPLYDVIVYVPNRAPDAIPEGVSCDKCAGTATGGPIASALTDAAGHFVLENAPVGSDIPLVIQVGKWRRQVTVTSVSACIDNPITDTNLTRLPRTKAEGHIPQMAITTGGSDALECLIRKIGIDDSEFTTDAGTGRVHMYVGGDVAAAKGEGAASFTPGLNGGAAFTPATTLWSSMDKLLKYDILLLSCEGSQYANVKMPLVGNIKAYADAGGRLFSDHLHFYWLRNGPLPWPMTAFYVSPGNAFPDPTTATVDATFPKGIALADWLVNVGGSTVRGQIDLYGAQQSVQGTVAPTQRWIYVPGAAPFTQYLSFNTPVEVAADAQCGRVVDTDIHVKAVPSNQNGKDDSDPSKPFPSACQSTILSPQEKALEFLFFDLSSCIIEDNRPPEPPPIVQ
jgi:hypothetical protein